MAYSNKLFNERNDAIKFEDDHSPMIFEAKRKAAEEEPKPKSTKAKIKCQKSPSELNEKFINKTENDEKIYK